VRGLFVTGTDTGVGKTILSAALLAAMAEAGEAVRAHKPVVTGLDEHSQPAIDDRSRGGFDDCSQPGRPLDPWPPDHELLGVAAGMAPDDVSPLRYGPAAAPHLAARLAGDRIDPAELLAAARRGSPGETLLVEGVGGLLVPLADDYTICDFAAALCLPVLIAARPGLGTINHSLLTLCVARAAGLDVRAVVLTPWPPQPTALERSNRDTIASLGEVEVETLADVARPDRRELARAGGSLPWRRWLESSAES
jgi:dethiobiotin synthetase